MALVLVIEDHAEMGELIRLLITESGHEAELAASVALAEEKLASKRYDLITLDVNLPDGNGLEFCARLRKRAVPAPVVLLTTEISAESVVAGLEAGAADYLKKPIDPKELQARLRAHIKTAISDETVLEFKNLKVDLERRTAHHKGRKLDLSQRQFEILTLLLRRPEAVVTREQVIQGLNRDLEIYDRTIDSHMSQLRKRLKDNGVTGIVISSIYGVGYRLE